MIRNYLKIAWRNLQRSKAHSFINITGLSVGMAVAVLIGLWIWDEFSFDKNFDHYARIVRLAQHQTSNGDVGTQNNMPIPLGYKLREDYKSDFKYVVLSRTEGHIISAGDKKLNMQGNFMQPEAPYLFTFNMLKGNRSGLNDPSSIMLSAKMAKSLFNDADPVNQVIKIDNKFVVKVTGVYLDFPRSSSFRDIDFVSTWDLYMTTQPFLKQYALNEWGNNSWDIYAELQPGAKADNVSAKIKDLKLNGLKLQGDKLGVSYKPVVFLQPISRWHLYSEYKNGVNTGGEIEYVWMLGIIGGFVLLLACINFMNLSTARSEKRAKEVGIRKTVGSLRSQLIGQFFSESIMLALLAFFIALILTQLILSWFNQLVDKQMVMPWNNPLFWLCCLIFSLITGIIAGSYPAFYLSSFQPVKVLKGTFKAGRLASLPRRVLVVLQFTVSVTLIIGTIVVFKQVQFTKNRPVGYNRTGMVQIHMTTWAIHNQFIAFRSDLQRSGAVLEVAESGGPVTAVWNDNSDINWRGKPPGLQCDFGTIPISPEYGNTVGWTLLAGRNFSHESPSDSSAIILNEAAVKFMGLKNPIGETVKWYKNFKVIGVAKDMVMTSPYNPVEPAIFYMSSYMGNYVDIRLNPGVSSHARLWPLSALSLPRSMTRQSPLTINLPIKNMLPNLPTKNALASWPAFLPSWLFISCLGLFGMASFMAEQRIKEIGVRKVLGASVFNLWKLLSRDFVGLVTISMLIAMPAAVYFMNSWLKDYNYHTEISWWVFAGTAAGAILITLLTVSFQGIKAALANPVKSLKTE